MDFVKTILEGEREGEDCDGVKEDQQQQHGGGHHGRPRRWRCRSSGIAHHGQRGCQPEWQHDRGTSQPGATEGHGKVS